MNIENFIKMEAMKLKNSRRKVDIAPDISESELASIVKKNRSLFGEDIGKYVLVLSKTATGTFFLTGDALYFDNFMQEGYKKVKYSDVETIQIEKGKTFSPDKVFLSTLHDRYILDGCIDGLNLDTIKEVFEHIINISKSDDSDFTVSEQGVLTHQLPMELKLLYLKILCNYAYLDDSMINAQEYNAITKYSVRMELTGENRAQLRTYMNDSQKRVKTGNLLAEVKEKTKNQTGFWDAIKYCLMQDALSIHNIQMPGKSWREDGFIGSLKDACCLTEHQVDSMVEAVSINRAMGQKDCEMNEMKARWRKLTNKIKDTDGYVPTPYLYCSGSVYGLKSYTGFLKKDETSNKAINKQRELILQEIIANNQKSVNVLIGDMNYLAERLEKALENEEKIQQDYKSIQLLLSRIKSAVSSVKEEEECKKEIDGNE